MIRAVLDTNVLASGAISTGSTLSAIIDSWFNDDYLLITSFPILHELERTLKNAYFASRLSPELITAYLSYVYAHSEIVSLTAKVEDVASHEEDDLILATAISGNTQYLVTGDLALQALEFYEDIEIVSPTVFRDILSTA